MKNEWNIFEWEKWSGDYYEWWNDGINWCMNKEGSATIWKERIKYIVSIKELIVRGFIDNQHYGMQIISVVEKNKW